MAVTQTEIKFQPNMPVTVRLDRNPAEAKEYASKFEGAEPRYRHTCDGNSHFFYLPSRAHRQLVKTLAESGDTVRITKAESGDSITWGVVVLAEEQVDTPVSTPGPRAVPARTSTNGANALAAQPAPPPPQRTANSHLAQCLYAAVDAAIETSEYARSRNFSVTFLGSDIRAMAASLYIQDNKQGGQY